MPRGRSYAKDPDTGLEIPGVGSHPRGGFYVINPSLTTPDRREFFGKSRTGLQAAKRRFAELSLAPPMAIEECESDDDVAERIHLTDDMIERSPELLDENRRVTHRPNPEYGKHLPRKQRIDAQIDALFAAGFTPRPPKSPRRRKLRSSENPDGQAITVAHVGELYRAWYAGEKWDVPELQALAAAHNVAARDPVERRGSPLPDRRYDVLSRRSAAPPSEVHGFAGAAPRRSHARRVGGPCQPRCRQGAGPWQCSQRNRDPLPEIGLYFRLRSLH
jgi:hypothetical protein